MTHTVFTWAGTTGFACPSATETKLVAINPLQITKPQSRRRISLFSHSAKKNSHHLAWRQSLNLLWAYRKARGAGPSHHLEGAPSKRILLGWGFCCGLQHAGAAFRAVH